MTGSLAALLVVEGLIVLGILPALLVARSQRKSKESA